MRVKTKGFIKPLALGGGKGFEFARTVRVFSSRAEGEGVRYGRRVRERVRGEYGFSSLMKQNKKGKKCAVFCFAGKRKLFFIYL